MPAPAPVGMPSELLERRPDVIAAERRVAAAFDRVEEAKAAQLPRISLTAGGSSVSSELIVLKDHSNPVWGLGANLIAPLYQGGALRAQVEMRTGRAEAGGRRVRPRCAARFQRRRECAVGRSRVA